MTAAELAERIGTTSQRGEWYDDHCPAHPDQRPSFSFTGGPRGLVLYCRAGCTTQAIVDALRKQYPGLDLGRIAFHGRSRRPPTDIYPYRDEHGDLVGEVLRFEPKDFRVRRPDGKGGWISNWKGVRRVLYRLNQLHGRKVVWVTEGEKDADRLWALPVAATTNPGGAGKWADDYSQQLKAQGVESVVILVDNDEAGENHAQIVARSCLQARLTVVIVRPPGLPDKGDISDWLDQGHDREDLKNLIRVGTLVNAVPPSPEASRATENHAAAGDALSDRLVLAATAEGIELFHTPLREPFVRVPVRQHHEVWALRGDAARTWLTGLAWRELGKALTSDRVGAALHVLEAKAIHDGPELPVHLRTAWDGDTLYYDLGDPDWHVVRVSASGWEILLSSPVRFRRYPGMAPQPAPEPGGNLDDLWSYVNVPDRQDRRLLTAWLVTALFPDIPRPILVLHGDQGGGKTTAARILASLVDPHQAPLVRARDEVEFVQALAHHYVAILDNLSYVRDWLSDLLSRAVTGEGFVKRRLYSDDDDVIYTFRRAIVLTGIHLAVTKPDLLDRALIIGIERMSDGARREDRHLLEEFTAAQPRLFGAVLDLLVGAMAQYHQVTLQHPPRMADFARWGAAVMRVLGQSVESFEQDLETNTNRQNEQAVAGSFTATLLLSFMADRPRWTGTAEELLGYLRGLAGSNGISRWDLPATPQAFGRRLREVRPNLAAFGLDIVVSKHHHPRTITITKREAR